ncbi:MAG: META domain-containing protein [Anaerolineae bacterium]|nr:META domain-containing protein [Anaerolineae bacterium]
MKLVKIFLLSLGLLVLVACTSTETPSSETTTTAVPEATTPADTGTAVETVEEVVEEPDTAVSDDPLSGTLWSLVSLQNTAGETVDVLPGSEVTIEFQDGGYGGNAGCNRYFGSYQIDGSNLSLGVAGSTEMFCMPEELTNQEGSFLAALGLVSQFEQDGGQLTLADKDGNVVLTFTAKQPATLTDMTWLGISYNNGRDAVVSALAEAQITAVFAADGTLSGSTGCNNYTTSYTTDGNNITISEQIATTRRACDQPRAEQEAAYLAALPQATTYSISGDRLELRAADGALLADYVAQPPTSLSDNTWLVTSYNSGGQATVSVISEMRLTAVFAADGTVSGNGGCNSFSGTYTTDGRNITISPLVSTMMACQEDVMQQETAYLAALQSAATYQLMGDTLELFTAEGARAVTFVAEAAPGLAGSNWDVISYNNGNQAVVSLILGTEITAQFGEDGTLSGFAGCNNYTTSYQVEGENITIDLAASTMMFCEAPEGVMEQEAQYLAALSTAVTYRIDGHQMEMRDATGALVAMLQEAGFVDPELQNFLANATYLVEESAAGSVTLVNGEYREPIAEGSASELVVTWTGDAVTGVINEQFVAATVINVHTGGTGTFYYLALFTQDESGQLVNTAVTPLGDRVIVNSLDITRNTIVVDMVQAGADDPMCCPSEHVEWVYALEENELVLVSETVIEP